MNRVTACPKTLEEVTFASKQLGCGNDRFGKNQYMCLPNVEKTSLFEFCHNGIMGIQEGGYCLEVNPSDGTLSTENCTDFISGCPEDVFWNHQFYLYPACQDINTGKQCYSSQPSCTKVQIVNLSDDFNTNILIVVLVISFMFFIFLIVLYVRKKRWTRQRLNKDKGGMYKVVKFDTEQTNELIPETESDYFIENTELVKHQRDLNVHEEGDAQKTRHRHKSNTLDYGRNFDRDVPMQKGGSLKRLWIHT